MNAISPYLPASPRISLRVVPSRLAGSWRASAARRTLSWAETPRRRSCASRSPTPSSYESSPRSCRRRVHGILSPHVQSHCISPLLFHLLSSLSLFARAPQWKNDGGDGSVVHRLFDIFQQFAADGRHDTDLEMDRRDLFGLDPDGLEIASSPAAVACALLSACLMSPSAVKTTASMPPSS